MEALYGFDDIKRFIAKKEPQGIIFDTGVLLPYVLGFYDPKLIEGAGFSKEGEIKFTELDFDLLKNIRGLFKKAFVTPQVLAEFSNIAKQAKGLKGEKIKYFFQAAITALSSKQESHYPMAGILGTDVSALTTYGFTDVGLLEIAKKENCAILTIDDKFARYAERQVAVILYNRIQASEMLS